MGRGQNRASGMTDWPTPGELEVFEIHPLSKIQQWWRRVTCYKGLPRFLGYSWLHKKEWTPLSTPM